MMARQKFKSIIRGSVWTFIAEELSSRVLKLWCVNIAVRNVNLSANLKIYMGITKCSLQNNVQLQPSFHCSFRGMSECFICAKHTMYLQKSPINIAHNSLSQLYSTFYKFDDCATRCKTIKLYKKLIVIF